MDDNTNVEANPIEPIDQNPQGAQEDPATGIDPLGATGQVNTAQGQAPKSLEDRFTAMEQQLADLWSLFHSGEKSVEREREMHVARNSKVPYVSPEIPAGLSPNQILQHLSKG